MKILRYLSAFLAVALTGLQAQDPGSPREQLVKTRKALRSLVLSKPENKRSIGKIIKLQREIQNIEQENGVSELQDQLAQLRVKSCRIQQENDESRQALAEIKQVSQKIRDITKPEREEINRMTSRRTKLESDSPEAEELENKIAQIQSQMQNKSAEHLRAIRQLNNRIYRQLPEQLEAGKQAALALKQKYAEVKNQIDPLDKQIAREVKLVHRRLRNKQGEFKKLRQAIVRARIKISKQDPCFAAKLSAKSNHWLERFV